MKIHKELLELSRKADKIIHASIDFNLDILKSFKEKALAIMACKSVEDLKNLTKTAEPEKKFQKFEIPLEETKVHLHSNKSSFASTSGFSDQNIADNSSELQTEEVYNYQQSINSSHAISEKKLLSENLNSKDDTFQQKTNKTDEFVDKNIHSKTSEQSFDTKRSKEGKSQNVIKINNFHSFAKTSSESSTSKHIGGVYSTTNFQFEKHRSIDIMEKIEESNEEIISNKFVTVSTMVKTSYRKSSNESLEKNKRNVHDNTYSGKDKFKETEHGSLHSNILEKFKQNDESIVSQKLVTVSGIIKTSYRKSSNNSFEPLIQIEGETCDENLNSDNDNLTDFHQTLPIDMLQLQFENTYNTDNIQSNEIFLSKNSILSSSEVNSNIDFSNDPGVIQISSDNVSRNLESEEFNPENILDTCKMNLVNQAINVNYSNVNNNTAQFPPKFPSSSQKNVRDSQSMYGTKPKILENILDPTRIIDEEPVDSNVSLNLKSKICSEMDSHVQTVSGKNNTEVNYVKNKFSKNKNIQSKKFLAVSTIPVLIENKESDSRKLNGDGRFKKKPRVKRSLLPKMSRSYNLRSAKNNPTLKMNSVNQIECSKLGLNKNLSLKEKVEVKKMLREQKMKLIRERRENLEKERRERRRLSEERRIKRFQQHEEIKKRKIMDVKSKVKSRKLRKEFSSSSEVSPEGNIEAQSLQAGSDRTYLVENFKDISPIEPTEKTQVRSSGEGLNYSLLYNSEYDRKIFMRQSVVLEDISQMMPPGTIQNCLNLIQSKETKPICNRTTNSTPPQKISKRKLSTIEKNGPNAPAKKPMRSTRKLSVSSSYNMRNEVTKEERSIEKGVEISDSVVLKTLQFAKAKDNSDMAEKLLSDPKLSMKTSVVLENISKSKLEEPSYSKVKAPIEPMKAAILSNNAISSKHDLSTPSPIVVLKGISNTGSNLPRSTNDKSKTVKVHFSDNANENDPKLSGIIRKGSFNSKSCSNNADKKLEKNTKKETKKKRKQDYLDNNKPRKKVLVIKKTPEKQKKVPSLSSKKNQESDTSSYEISDISDNSITIVEQKAKKIPTWASNIHLKQAILKQHYGPQDPDAIFGNFKNQKAIDLAEIFTSDKIKYHTRTSSAKWSADESPI